MKISLDDPRLTAYAFGEITDEKELAEIQAAIAESKELQNAVQEIREMGNLLSEEFGSDPVPELSEFEKAKLEQEPKKDSSKIIVLRNRLMSWPFALATAAAAVVALVLLPQAVLLYQDDPTNGVRRQDGEIVDMKPAPEKNVVVAAPPKMEGKERIIQLSVPEPQFERSPFTVDASEDKGYYARSSLAGSRLKTDRVEVGSSIEVVAQEFMQDIGANDMSEMLLYSTTTEIGGAVGKFNNGFNTENYDMIEETGFRSPMVAPLSTFSIDVDTASYANVRRFLNSGNLPPKDAVRIEEMVNYFSYADSPPKKSLEDGGDPFAVHMTQTSAPWNEDHRLLRIALKGYEMPWEERPASNLVFLLDVSGSMNNANKLPLVKKSMDMLINRLDERDRVSIVVYAGASGLVLPSTTANNRQTISHAMNNLKAGGSTNAGAGIELAYKQAREHFIEGGNNRVILCTDGDFNVGVTNRGDLAATADAEAEKGIRLTILGFGMGNYKDGMLEELSNKGKGSYAYVDSNVEARKVFLNDLTSNLFTIAKDVKIQVEFNPAKIHSYRLIGYENRRLKAEDFNDDKKKAGDIGPGHSLVALYELIPVDLSVDLPSVDELRYQSKAELNERSDEVATVKLRYKHPQEDISKLISEAIREDDMVAFANTSEDVRFSAAVAAFGMRLSGSKYAGNVTYQQIERIASGAIGVDSGGFRSEFIDLVRRAQEL